MLCSRTRPGRSPGQPGAGSPQALVTQPRGAPSREWGARRAHRSPSPAAPMLLPLGPASSAACRPPAPRPSLLRPPEPPSLHWLACRGSVGFKGHRANRRAKPGGQLLSPSCSGPSSNQEAGTLLRGSHYGVWRGGWAAPLGLWLAPTARSRPGEERVGVHCGPAGWSQAGQEVGGSALSGPLPPALLCFSWRSSCLWLRSGSQGVGSNPR